MERVGEHPVPVGPLAVRWLGHDLPELRAGVAAPARVALRNDGTATWRSRGESGVQLSYHWLDDRGNAIVWDGPRVALRTAGRARRGGRAGDARCGRRSRRAATGSRSTSSRSSASGSRRSAPRRSSSTSSSRRGSPSGAWPSSSTAATMRRPPPRSPRRRSRSSRRTRSRPRTSSRARFPSPTGHAACSTRTPRASPRSAARSSRATGRCEPWAPGGGRNPAFGTSAPAPLTPGRARARRASGPSRLRARRRTGDLRRPDQTSTATRSSTRLKTNAPSPRASTADTAR